MAIIGNVERKNWKVKLLNIIIHVVLIIGATTMVYPLLLMVSGSFKSTVDFKSFNIIPQFLYDNDALFRKHTFTKYNTVVTTAFGNYKEPDASIDNITGPKEVNAARVNDYKAFIAEKGKTLPHYWRGIGMAMEQGVFPLVLREYKDYMKEKYGEGKAGIEKLNKASGTDYTEWDEVTLPSENFTGRRSSSDYSNGILSQILIFKESRLDNLRTIWFDIDSFFLTALRRDCGRNLEQINSKLGTHYNNWSEISVPAKCPSDNKALAKVWNTFVREDLSFAFIKVNQSAKPAWIAYLKSKYNTLENINAMLLKDYKSFDEIVLPETEPASGQIRTDWGDFISQQKAPEQSLEISTLGSLYRDYLKEKYGALEKLNKAYDLGFKSFKSIPLPSAYPDYNLAEAKDWLEFLNLQRPEDVGLSRNSTFDYKSFVESKYKSKNKNSGEVDLSAISQDYGYPVKDKNSLPSYRSFPSSEKDTQIARTHYIEALKLAKFAKNREIRDTSKLQDSWSKFLEGKYSTVDKLNSAWGKTYASWEKITLPTKEYEWTLMLENRKMIIKEYFKRNYSMVVDTIFTNGNAAMNTLIYCCLSVLAALIVNPLCAYGLSRYKPASSYKILLFLMLPMAFPGMVLGIPQFLLIKDFGLLNTFAALILPGMANGYSIFLLKGFFDSLPKELFESAAIDGASEWTVFWHIAMSLSTPILSVIALGSFTAAYGNFMMAFLFCQEKSMWTMMVYLFQLQQRANPAVGFAALIVAAIPTLLVFIFCQNIIIKGIVVPTEK